MISATRFIYTVILTLGLLLCLHLGKAHAQSVTLISATQQRWAGGICCRHGEYYNIELKIVQGKTPVTLDSLWLNGYCSSLAQYNPKKTKPGETLYVKITQDIVVDDYYNEQEIKCFDPNKLGVSFSYYIKGELKMMDVTPYIKHLEFIGYP